MKLAKESIHAFAEYLRHGHSCIKTAVLYGRISAMRQGDRGLQE